MARQLILKAKVLACIPLVAIEDGKEYKDRERYTLLHLEDADDATVTNLKKSGLIAYDDKTDDQSALPDKYKAGVIFGHEEGIAEPKAVEVVSK